MSEVGEKKESRNEMSKNKEFRNWKILKFYFLSGYLGPGGIQDELRYFNCVGGMTGYVDRIVLGKNHIYQYPTSADVYKSGPFDPEGLLGKFF